MIYLQETKQQEQKAHPPSLSLPSLSLFLIPLLSPRTLWFFLSLALSFSLSLSLSLSLFSISLSHTHTHTHTHTRTHTHTHKHRHKNTHTHTDTHILHHWFLWRGVGGFSDDISPPPNLSLLRLWSGSPHHPRSERSARSYNPAAVLITTPLTRPPRL